MNEHERFEIAREIVRHEDGLVNNRVTWLLVLQGFLFGAFVSGVGLYKDLLSRRLEPFLTAGLSVIALLGIVVSMTASNNIRAAYRHMTEVKKWWDQSTHTESFPPLYGEWPGYFWSTVNLPRVLATVWVALLVLLYAAGCGWLQ
jgi:hypothetical protein